MRSKKSVEIEKFERRALILLHKADGMRRTAIRDIDRAIEHLIIAKDAYSNMGEGYEYKAKAIQENVYELQRFRDKLFEERDRY